MKEYIIETEDKIGRLDKVVSLLDSNISRTYAQKMIKNGDILVNGNSVKESYKTSIGDTIKIEELIVEETNIKPQDIDLDVIYEDNDIIVVNKPKGMVVHPGNGNKDNTLANAVMNRCKGSLSAIGGKIRPGIVHRLDKDTTGLIIVAKNDLAHINMSNQIKERRVKKTYIALVRGRIKENEATINMPIARSTQDRKKMAVDKKGKEAITHFKVIKKYRNFTLIELNIETGRTHQIRVHMAEIGFPVVGDATYSNGKNPFGVSSQLLHAKKLEFLHPITNLRIELEAPLPEEFKKVLDVLDKED